MFKSQQSLKRIHSKTKNFTFQILLLAHGAALPGRGLMGEGREAGGGAEQVGGAFALIGRLAFL